MTEGAEVSYPDSVVDYFLGNTVSLRAASLRICRKSC